jgi:hypothetical protein
MGAALTYDQRYALFTWWGLPVKMTSMGRIWGPAPNRAPFQPHLPHGRSSNGHAAADGGPAPAGARRPLARPAKPVLAPDQSAALWDRLVAELDGLQSTDAAADWALRSLPAKNTLTAADAERIEAGFRCKLAEFGDGRSGTGLPHSRVETHPASRSARSPPARNRCACRGRTVARLGGDEFAIICPGVQGKEELVGLADRICAAIKEPYDLGGMQAVVDVSIGVSCAPDNARGSDELMKQADVALYRAKADGRGAHRFFEPEMVSRIEAQRKLEADLRRGLINGHLELFYQPVVNIADNRIVGVEGLLR